MGILARNRLWNSRKRNMCVSGGKLFFEGFFMLTKLKKPLYNSTGTAYINSAEYKITSFVFSINKD